MLARAQKDLTISAGPFGILCFPLFVMVTEILVDIVYNTKLIVILGFKDLIFYSVYVNIIIKQIALEVNYLKHSKFNY